jgi:hypothetical protein
MCGKLKDKYRYIISREIDIESYELKKVKVLPLRLESLKR